MDSLLVESGEKLEEIVNVHLGGTAFSHVRLYEDVFYDLGKVVFGHGIVFGAPDLVVGMEHVDDALGAKEAGADDLVAAGEDDAGETVKLLEWDRRRWVEWRDAHD